MEQIKKYNEKTFEAIKYKDENGKEYWLARELQIILEYKKWENFYNSIERSMLACKNSGEDYLYHFPEVRKTIQMPKGAEKEVDDFKLSRYACYLIVMNGDPRKEIIALGQTYFAVQTRKQEITEEEYIGLSEDERRIYQRKKVKSKNNTLFEVAKNSGVENFGRFNNAGYLGLYTETAEQIKERKQLSKKDEILDFMGSEELGANLFRITQTEAKLKRDSINNEREACSTHNQVGKAIRKVIKQVGGTMPEKLSTPDKGIKELEKSIKTLK